VGHRTSNADFVLLDVSDPARQRLEGWTDGGAKPECCIPPAMDRAKKWSQGEYSRLGYIISTVRSPLFSEASSNTPSCKGIGVLLTQIYDWSVSVVKQLNEARPSDADVGLHPAKDRFYEYPWYGVYTECCNSVHVGSQVD